MNRHSTPVHTQNKSLLKSFVSVPSPKLAGKLKTEGLFKRLSFSTPTSDLLHARPPDLGPEEMFPSQSQTCMQTLYACMRYACTYIYVYLYLDKNLHKCRYLSPYLQTTFWCLWLVKGPLLRSLPQHRGVMPRPELLNRSPGDVPWTSTLALADHKNYSQDKGGSRSILIEREIEKGTLT